MKKILHRLLLATPAALLVSALALPQAAMAIVPTVLTVPFQPGSPTTPHTTYPGATVVLGATVPNIVGSTDTFTAVWNFADGSPNVTINPITKPYDISTSHKFPTSSGTGTIWVAKVTVTDTTTSQSASGSYYVIQEPNQLSIRVNVAIDWGLWYMHQTMWRNSTTVSSTTVQWGGWDTQTYPCNNVNGNAYDCIYYGSIDAENVQAFEVNGHLASGPAADPYTDDVARGLARATNFIASEAVLPNPYQYNPAKAAYTCKDGSVPQTTDPLCASHGGQYFYNPGATSCTSPPCSITFDGNNNKLMAYSNDGSGEYTYTTSPFLDALVDSSTPNAKALTGPVGIVGATYQNIVQDILDFYGYSQYEYDYDVSQGYTRGYGGSDQGGGWLYGPQQGDDNSTSQWAAIGYISGFRGAGITIPPAITDFNQVWITNGQDVTDAKPTAADPFSANDNFGAFGYRGSFAYSNAWGPFAVTPSGMVQMAMDGVGRTTNTTFGDSATAPDQRWNNTETYYADNFCNSLTNGAYYAPRAYMYGMFSFTKSMLLHDPAGNLSPIQYLRTQTPGVFTTNSSVPKNTIDWYNALSTANGGTDPCDGVAQTLVTQQQPDGHWFANDYNGSQYYYETAWALIMLKAVILHPCPSDLQGRGTPSGTAAARVDLTWSNESYASSYNVKRGTASGGPYTLVGNTTSTAFSDRTGLANGTTYYYVVDPLINTAEACVSNQATVPVPKAR
jgi:hypothetical protein